MKIQLNYTTGEESMVIAKNIHPKFSGKIVTWPTGKEGPVGEFGWQNGELQAQRITDATHEGAAPSSRVTIELNSNGELVLDQHGSGDTCYLGFIDSPDAEACEL